MRAPKGQTYKFSPLPSKSSIRLLRILSGPEEQRIRCSLEVVDLDNTPEPEYDCLSYTWGNPLYQKILPPQNGREITGERKFRIECDDLIICVAENLLEALDQLSRNGLSSTSGPHRYQRRDRIWIDAICIHQEDIEERSSQVAMMERIYRQAQNVVVWLGPDDELTELGIEVMQRLALVPAEKRELELPDDLDDAEVYRVLGIPICMLQDWLALATFLQRTWFSRVWVLQESSAAREIVVFCGTHVLNWADITDASKTLGETGLGRLLRERVENVTTTAIESTKYVGNTLNNLYIFEEIRENARSLSLETLLQYSRYFGATDKMDHVYAVLGMWKPVPRHQAASDSITPKYSLRVEDVFAKASLVSIREMGDLNLLSLVEGLPFRSEEMGSLPSWVPDYTATPFTEPLRGNPRPSEGEDRWHASEGLEWEEPGDLDLPLLPVRGIHVSTVTHRAATEAKIIDEHQEHTLLALLKHCLDSLSTPYEDGAIDAFWRTLIKDTFRASPVGKEEASGEARRAFATLITIWVWQLETLISELKDSPTSNPTGPPLHQTFADAYSQLHSLILDLSPRDQTHTIPTWPTIRSTINLGEDNLPETFDPDYEHIISSFRLAYMGRRLFLASSGHLGIGPESLEEGDEVWVLAGAKVPMVLRKVEEGGGGNEKYVLVGEAYVHGIMEGEAVKRTGGGDEKGRKIYLQ